MCGIVGVLGNHEAAPLLVEALKRLEYRGYDSAGIATLNNGTLERRRAVGKLVNLSDKLVHEPLAGKAGIGHTRWATHGKATEANAHPHKAGPVAVVHNGIIENFRELREELAADGYTPQSETDTETVALLAQKYLDAGQEPEAAAKSTIAKLDGAYALCFLFDGHDDLMIAARQGSPLAIGHGEGEMFVGSDALALAPMTDQITYLDEGDIAVITRDSLSIFDASGAPVQRARKAVNLDAATVEKAGHKHYMAKEIAEQPTVIADAVQHYISSADTVILPDDLNLDEFDRILMVACGTAYLACFTAKYWFEQIAKMPVEVDIASEYRYREAPISPRTLAIFVSQSGETADTLAALRYVAGKADKIVTLTNSTESSMARESDITLPFHAGVEISVASTKAFTCQLIVLLAMALDAATTKGHLAQDGMANYADAMRSLPGLLNKAMDTHEKITAISHDLAEASDILFLGRGGMYPLALEGALKLKELSYIHAEGYASGELKHGPIALVDPHTPIIVLAPRDRLFEKTVSNMQEVMARGGKVVLISDAQGLREAGEGLWHSIEMPSVADDLAPILYAVPAQLLAYHTAVIKGTDVDQPRNLAKSVTVE